MREEDWQMMAEQAAVILDKVWPCGSDEMRSKQGVAKWEADNEKEVFAPTRDWLSRFRSRKAEASQPAADGEKSVLLPCGHPNRMVCSAAMCDGAFIGARSTLRPDEVSEAKDGSTGSAGYRAGMLQAAKAIAERVKNAPKQNPDMLDRAFARGFEAAKKHAADVLRAEADATTERPHTAETSELHIVFDGPPGPSAGHFVEVENAEGRSVRVGRWQEQANGWWHLILPRTDASQSVSAEGVDRSGLR